MSTTTKSGAELGEHTQYVERYGLTYSTLAV